MSEVLIRKLERRNPFRITQLPPAVAFSRYAQLHPSPFARRWLTKWAKAAITFAHSYMGFAAPGVMEMEWDSGTLELTIDAANSHYGHLYRGGEVQEYEPRVSALIDTLVAGADCFLDVGANWGYYALFASTNPAFQGITHAFEPMVETHDDMKRLVNQAGLGERIICHQTALSDTTTTMAMIRGIHSALARLDENATGPRVPVQRLDDLDIPTPDVMKIDVEGHEARLLAGGRQAIAKGRPMVVFESLTDRNEPARTLEPFTELTALGYRFFQPLWQIADGLSDDDSLVTGNAAATLALREFTPDQRLDLGGDMDVLACHRESIARLEDLFSPVVELAEILPGGT